MLDFLIISTRTTKNSFDIFPRFAIKKSKDLMIRGGDFYAIWVEEKGLWSTDEFEAFALIDYELDSFYEKNKNSFPQGARVLHMWDSDSGSVDRWHRYCQGQMRDNYTTLDDRLIFANEQTKRGDFASKKLPYPFEDSDISSWDRLVGTLYEPEERLKIEWAIGAVVSGDSKSIQKFLVFYGGPGTGKSTILNIIQLLFDGYWSAFTSKDLTSKTNVFALEAFKSNPLVSIEHDGKLDRIEDNTMLNSLVSHEQMVVNEKYRSTYTSKFRTFLFIGTNKPVKITDSKSGLIRRLIDVHPSNSKIEFHEYMNLMGRIPFELGGIAKHCLEVYRQNRDIYNDYIPLRMMDASNDFYNFLLDNYYGLSKEDGISLKDAWDMYKQYAQESNLQYPMTKRVFKEEMKAYFFKYYDRNPEGRHQLDWYSGFRTDKFEQHVGKKESTKKVGWLSPDMLVEQQSVLDDMWRDCPAQYATKDGVPSKKWDSVQTTLKDIDTRQLHYVQNPIEHIVIDCDLRDENGNKSLDHNVDFANSLPPTYCEASKSGGLHLHYAYSGDSSLLCPILADGIEVKVRSGNSAIRRKLTICNNLSMATISSGLPTKAEGEKTMVNPSIIRSENILRKRVIRNLNKEIHGDTTSSIDFIKALLDEAYDSGMKYDLRDLQNDVYNFASQSTNQSTRCLKTCLDMKFVSKDASEGVPEPPDAPFCFFDIEIFKNLFILVWKLQGPENACVSLINPDPSIIREFITSSMRKIGFNNRRYDNHLLYAYAYRNYTIYDLYRMSKNIVNSKISKYFIGEAYNLSYTDIYDFASAQNKKSLKKLEIEMGIHHQECPYPWDEPVDESHWQEVADYCRNDVLATEAAFDYLHDDYLARVILADISGGIPNNTTNQLSTKLIFGDNKNPQSEFNYRDLSKPVRPGDPILSNMGDREFRIFDENGSPTYKTWDKISDIPNGYSLLPFFPGYTFSFGKSVYRNTEIGEGGYVYAEPGMYRYVPLLDVASMHPSSILEECLFGEKYTERYGSVVNLRVDIKHERFERAREAFGGKLAKWLEDTSHITGLADALKTVINSGYGLTSASFENPWHDPRNIDNIVAKRGALFMRNLQSEIQSRGYTVAHIKTDSIKIPKAPPEIIDFVMAYGREFGYNFEYEARYDCMTLVNDAVYIARYDEFGIRNKKGKKAGEWTATGKQFAVPYVFKTLFSRENLVFEDLCETFAVKTKLFLDVNEGLEDVSIYEKELKKIRYTEDGSGTITLNQDPMVQERIKELMEKIEKGHNRCFVGKTGEFCPMTPGAGGGLLYRAGENKFGEITYSFVSGCSGRRWMESEKVKKLGLEDKIDMSYFEELAKDAMSAIEQYGGFEWFTNHDLSDPNDEILPF